RRTLDPDGLINNPLAARLLEKGNEIKAVCLAVEPARVVPPGAHDDVGADLERRRDPVGLQIGTITHADFARDEIGPINDLTFALVRQYKGRKASARKIKDRRDAPPATGFACSPSSLPTRRGVTQPDRPALARSQACLARASTDQSANQLFEPLG